MNHAEATRRLLDVLPNPSGDPVARDLAAHLELCSECRTWHETFELLRASVQSPGRDDHPPSDVIALCAARPDEMFEPGRADLRVHLETCGECRRDVDLMRAALEHARSPKAERPPVWNPLHGRTGRPWAALAATAVGSLALAAILAGVFGGRSDPHRLASSANEPRAGADGRAVTKTIGNSSLGDITGQREIRLGINETLVQTKITDGSRVTIRGDERLSFGNGFAIGSDTRVVVGINAQDRGDAGRPLAKQHRTAG